MAITPDITGNPFLVTGTTNTNDKITDGRVFIKYVYWYNPTTVGHLVHLVDKSRKEILKLRCEAANESQPFALWTAWDGIYCDDMDSGELKIYVS